MGELTRGSAPEPGPLRPGRRAEQYRGNRKVRRVLVIAIDGSVVTVQALHGPLAGARYDVARSDLRAMG